MSKEPVELNAESEEAVREVNAPEDAVVAPTVPLMLKLAAVPVIFVPTNALGVPSAGVTNVGEVANTAEPVPVSSVKAAARFALDGVARKVATPVPRPDTPVAIGRPVAFVKVALVGVPRIGVTRVGEVANTADPVPVSSVKAPKRLAELNEPKEVALPTEVTAPVKLALVVTLPAVRPEAVPVMFVPTKADGVPKAGVTRVGLVANTADPVPVSSVNAASKFAELNDPKDVALPTEVTAPVRLALVTTVAALPTEVTPPVRLAFVVTVPAVKPDAVPVMFVPTSAEGVPNAGVTKVGLFDNTTLPVPVELVTPVPPLATARVPVMSAVERLTASHVAFVPSV
jgi:hypothetical protein